MSDANTPNKWQRMSPPAIAIFALTLILSLLTFIGAGALRNQAGLLPEGAVFAQAELIRSSGFALGLSIGLFGSAFLLAAPRSWRPLCNATIMFALGQMTLAFVAKEFISQRAMGHSASPAILLIPSALFVCSIISIVRTMSGLRRGKTISAPSNEEPQQTLSQP